MSLKRTVLIMAGGKGERFWPKSRSALPKQFLSLTPDGKSMIQLTLERVLPLTSMEDVYIATNESYKELVRKQLPDLPPQNILMEPVGRNTAPCIGLGAVHIAKKHSDAVMLVLPSDHFIKNVEAFRETLSKVCETAEQGNSLVTIGIRPNYPETGYGYIQYHKDEKGAKAYSVKRFVEKPDGETAKRYVKEGDYLWNSGMFAWKASTILRNIESFLPETYQGLAKIGDAVGTSEYEAVLQSEFPQFASESIDYGVMEKAKSIFIYPGDFGWDDVGSWLALERMKPRDGEGNVLTGNVLPYATQGCIIEGGDKLIATVGLKDVVIVDTPDVTLVCDKGRMQDIKKVVALLREGKKEEYL